MARNLLSLWVTHTLIWSPLVVFAARRGGGSLSAISAVTYPQLGLFLLLSWLVTGLLGSLLVVPGLTRLIEQGSAPQPPALAGTPPRELAGDAARDLAGDALSVLAEVQADLAGVWAGACTSGCLFGAARVVAGTLSGILALLVAGEAGRLGGGVGAVLVPFAALVAGVQLADAWGQLVLGGLNLMLIYWLASLGVGALGGAAAGAALGSVVPVVGTLVGGVAGMLAGLLLGRWLTESFRYHTRGVEHLASAGLAGLTAGVVTGAYAGPLWGLAAGGLAVWLSFNAGCGVAGVAAGSFDPPRRVGTTRLHGWPVLAGALLVNGLLALALLL